MPFLVFPNAAAQARVPRPDICPPWDVRSRPTDSLAPATRAHPSGRLRLRTASYLPPSALSLQPPGCPKAKPAPLSGSELRRSQCRGSVRLLRLAKAAVRSGRAGSGTDGRRLCLNARGVTGVRFLALLACTTALLLSVASTFAAERSGLRINPQNPYYFVYNGKPFYLIGSGMESVCNEWGQTEQQWRDYLDMLHRNRVNRVRLFPWSFCWEKALKPTFSPWRVLDPVKFKFDVQNFNPDYWHLIRRIVEMARDRGIVVEYIIFDYCSLRLRPEAPAWFHNPLSQHAGGAVPGRDGRPAIYKFADYSDLQLFRQPCSPSWPWPKRNQWIQQRYVKHTIDQLAHYENIYWEIMNEQGYGSVEPNGPEWTRHWLRFLDRYDRYRRLRAINANPVYWKMEGMDIVCEHPIPYFNHSLKTPEVAVSIIRRARRYGKPVVCDETGFFPPMEGPAGQTKPDERQPLRWANERRAFWYSFVAGGHWTAAAWRPFNERPTHKWCKILADFVDRVEYWRMAPHDDLVEGKHAHCLARPGQEYVVYMGRGGQVMIKLGRAKADGFRAQWLNPRDGRLAPAQGVAVQGGMTFTAPDSEDWVLWLKRK